MKKQTFYCNLDADLIAQLQTLENSGVFVNSALRDALTNAPKIRTVLHLNGEKINVYSDRDLSGTLEFNVKFTKK